MCVICIKPANVQMPDKDIIRAMAQANPDGFGFAASNGMNGASMNFIQFYKMLSRVPDSAACILHFRWATHGSKCLKNCHPFYDKETNVWFAHNGVLPIESKNDMTDSEICFRKTLVPAIKKYGLASKMFDEISDNQRGGSRFVYMQGEDVYFQGNFTELDGCLYSNLNWQYKLLEQGRMIYPYAI